jgi:hypothetical protein
VHKAPLSPAAGKLPQKKKGDRNRSNCYNRHGYSSFAPQGYHKGSSAEDPFTRSVFSHFSANIRTQLT